MPSVWDVADDVPESERDATKRKLEKMENHVKTRFNDFKWSYDDFEIGCFLGRGKFGRVYLARDIHSHSTFALKLMHKTEIVRNHCERQVLREIEIQCHLRHPHILRLFTYFDDSRFIFLVLEFAAGGELYKHMQKQKNKHFGNEQAAKYLYQVVDALIYCHKKHVMHRDLKPENILLSADDNVKLSDFGWSVHAPTRNRRTMCGTLDYLPPEMVDHIDYSEKVDNWCVGVLLYEFLTGKAPFETPSNSTTYEKIRSLDYTIPAHVSSGGKDLIRKLLVKEPSGRLTLPNVQKHYWILENYPAARELLYKV